LDHDHVTARGGDSGSDRRALSAVHRVANHFDVRLFGQAQQSFIRAIAAPVINKDDLHWQPGRPQPLYDCIDRLDFIEDWDDYGQQKRLGQCIDRKPPRDGVTENSLAMINILR
jgi:hypothetical protein